MTLLLLGFRPTERADRAARLRFGLTASLIMLIVISIPLALVFTRLVQETRIRQTIDQVLADELDGQAGMTLEGFDFEVEESVIDLSVTIHAQHELRGETATGLRDSLNQSLDRPVRLTVVTIPVVEIRVPSPPGLPPAAPHLNDPGAANPEGRPTRLPDSPPPPAAPPRWRRSCA